MNLIEELLKENKSFTKDAKKKNNEKRVVKEDYYAPDHYDEKGYSSEKKEFLRKFNKIYYGYYGTRRDIAKQVFRIFDKYAVGGLIYVDDCWDRASEEDRDKVMNILNDGLKESKKKVTKEFLDRSITIGDVGSGNSPSADVDANVDADVDADVKDSSFGAGGTGGDVIKKKDEEECLKEGKEVDEDIINQLVVDLFDKLGLDVYDTDPDIRFDELVYAIYEIYQDHKHNVKEGILSKALDMIKDPAKSGVSTLLGDKEEKEELLKEGYSDNHIELKFKSGSTLDDDTYYRLFDITANGVAIDPSDDYEAGTPLPWDASIDIKGDKAIINGSLGPGGVDTDCNCEITLPVTKVNKYYNVYVDANEEDYDEVVDLLTKCNLM